MERGYRRPVPWLAKVLLLALKTKRGRELLFAGGMGVVEIVRSERALGLYARAWEMTTHAADRVNRKRAQFRR